MPTTARLPRTRPPRIVVARPAPTIDAGMYPAKATVGDAVALSADVVRDGHEVLRAEVRVRPPGGRWRNRWESSG